MSVNGITGSNQDAYSTYSSTQKATAKTDKESAAKDNTSGVIYEPSDSSQKTERKTYKPNPELIAKLKADTDARSQKLQGLVQQMMSQQGKTLGQSDSIWSFLAGGNFSVDPAVKAQAQKDIADDGYWGVDQTSQRIVDFANAITGGDPSKIEEMKNAFNKGFKQATKTWGSELPDISQRTYKAVMDKFDALAKEPAATTN